MGPRPGSVRTSAYWRGKHAVVKLTKGGPWAVTAISVLTLAAVLTTAGQAFAGPRDHSTSTAASASGPRTTPGSAGQDHLNGNIIVAVPPTPDRRHLRKLCTELLSGRSSGTEGRDNGHDQGTNTIPDLIAATGGTKALAVAWCRQYLHPHHPKRKSKDQDTKPKRSAPRR